MMEERVCELAQSEIDKQMLLAAMSTELKVRSSYYEVAAALSMLLSRYKQEITQ